MTINQKILMAMAYRGINQADLARKMGWSQQNLYSKLKNAKYSQEDLEKFAAALGAEFVPTFKMDDGTII